MAVEIYLPQLGLTMTEGVVTRWLKAPGDQVKKGEPVLEIETDKTTAEIEAPADGILGPFLVAEGAAVPIGGIVTHVLALGERPPSGASKTVAGIPSKTVAPVAVTATGASLQQPPMEGHVVASPRARRLAYQLRIDLRQVEASGPGGRVVEADVRWHADQVRTPEPAVTPVARRLAEQLGIDLKSVKGTGPGGRITKEDVARSEAQHPAAPVATLAPAEGFEPLKGIRRVVAERMTHSFTSTPHFYLSAEVDASALMRMREGLLAKVEKATGVRLTVTDILVKVCAQALVGFPGINVLWSEGEPDGPGGAIRRPDVNVGVAVSTDDGLLVPVVLKADLLSLAEIAQRRTDLVERARARKLTLSDLEGGTFTLTNLGMFRVDQFQAIINSPQAAILAVGRVRERPIAQDGAVVIRPTVGLTLSVDHRLVDGAEGARFLERVAQLIEEPYLLLG